MALNHPIRERLRGRNDLLVGFRSKRDMMRFHFGRGRIKMKDKADALEFRRKKRDRFKKWRV